MSPICGKNMSRLWMVSAPGSHRSHRGGPGQDETVKFCLCATPGEGRDEAFEAYYDSFPEWFHPRK